MTTMRRSVRRLGRIPFCSEPLLLNSGKHIEMHNPWGKRDESAEFQKCTYIYLRNNTLGIFQIS